MFVANFSIARPTRPRGDQIFPKMSGNGKFKSLLRSSFKKNKNPYQSWEDEDSMLDYDIDDQVTRSQEVKIEPELQQHSKGLAECFYLGSFDMSGRTLTGRGCIDTPAGYIWSQSHEKNGKPRRKNSIKQSLDMDIRMPINSLVSVSKPAKFVRLVATEDELEIYDDTTDELTLQFSFSKISFVGTHPKHAQLFVFIGVAMGSQTPFCHAFKCSSKERASHTAESLSDIFCKKIQGMQVHNSTITTVH